MANTNRLRALTQERDGGAALRAELVAVEQAPRAKEEALEAIDTFLESLAAPVELSIGRLVSPASSVLGTGSALATITAEMSRKLAAGGRYNSESFMHGLLALLFPERIREAHSSKRSNATARRTRPGFPPLRARRARQSSASRSSRASAARSSWSARSRPKARASIGVRMRIRPCCSMRCSRPRRDSEPARVSGCVLPRRHAGRLLAGACGLGHAGTFDLTRGDR